ncbi:MAG TPA: hypothetical protein VFD05_02695 [Bacilli bacterium]|nr:hypothetical protein [Bacilli bacterium]
MKKQKRKCVKQSFVYKLFTFFLIGIGLFNFVGNFVGITASHTFYHFGFTTTLYASRYFEDFIATNYTLRIVIIGATTVLTSAIFFWLFHLERRYKYIPLIAGILLYVADYALLFFLPIHESTNHLKTLHTIHLLFFVYLFVVLLALLITLPRRRIKYDFA